MRTSGPGLKGTLLFRVISTLEELEKQPQRNEDDGRPGRGCGSLTRPCSESRLGEDSRSSWDSKGKSRETFGKQCRVNLNFIFQFSSFPLKALFLSNIVFDFLDERSNIFPGNPLINHANFTAESFAHI
jgi:hypothetical protein